MTPPEAVIPCVRDLFLAWLVVVMVSQFVKVL